MRPFSEKNVSEKRVPGAGRDDSEASSAPSSTHQKARQIRDQLYREAIENPDSEAHEIVNSLLFAGIVRTGADPYEEAHWDAMGEERGGRGAAAARGTKPAAARKRDELRQRTRSADPEVSQLRAKLIEVSGAAHAAQAALEAGQPMDHMAIYNRIAEVIGLRPPSQPSEQQSQSGATISTGEPRAGGRPEGLGSTDSE